MITRRRLPAHLQRPDLPTAALDARYGAIWRASWDEDGRLCVVAPDYTRERIPGLGRRLRVDFFHPEGPEWETLLRPVPPARS